MDIKTPFLLCFLTSLSLLGCSKEKPPQDARILTLNAGLAVGMDEIRYAPDSKRLLVPGAGTGKLFLFDPKDLSKQEVPGFSTAAPSASHGSGATTVAPGKGLVLSCDRDTRRLLVIRDGAIVQSAQLGATPDYVRYVPQTDEAWVTEPASERIEIFSLKGGVLAPSGSISVVGGPEDLEIDDQRGRAYTHLWKGQTIAIDVQSRALGAPFANHCSDSRGLVLDVQRGLLMVGCAEGRFVVLDLQGKVLSETAVDKDVDNMGYSPWLRHAYVPTGAHAVTAVLAVDDQGQVKQVGAIGGGTQCATADELAQVWICDPDGGRLVVVKDSFKP